jgi:CBS domain-containing protein
MGDDPKQASMSTPVTLFRGSYLIPDPEHATVADVMRRGVVACHADGSLRHVADAKAAHRGARDRGRRRRRRRRARRAPCLGVTSHLDLARTFSLDRDTATAADIAAVDTAGPAAQLMDEHGVSHLIVASGGHVARRRRRRCAA